MARSYKPVDASKLRTYSVRGRKHRARAVAAALPEPGASAAALINSFPEYLGATAFRKVVRAIVAARRHDRPVVAAFGAHVIKVGCGPILVDLMRRGIITAVAGHGACGIHDAELALFGETSEEVAETIRDGSFGMVEETLGFFDAVGAAAHREGLGLGAAIGRMLTEQAAPHRAESVFAVAHEMGLPATVHVALGTDTVHVSAQADGAALGAASLRDFRLLCAVVGDLGACAEHPGVGGVWLNIGSAVLLPEVFLKAVAVARNLGADLDCMNTANFDMMRHYRPAQNVLIRPAVKGNGHEVVGHHEIMLPLLRLAVLEDMTAQGS